MFNIIAERFTLKHIFRIYSFLCISLIFFSGCMGTFFSNPPEKTHIIAVPYGSTIQQNNFKFAAKKPTGHIFWGPETADGAQCTVIITNVSIDKLVYRRDFSYDREMMMGKGFMFTGGKIYEPTPYWFHRVGEYVVTLYVEDQRVSADQFNILP